MSEEKREQFLDIGLLILRAGIGMMFIAHGYPKISGGTVAWGSLGKTMHIFGITSFSVFWGFLSAFAEFFGGIFLIAGMFFRPFCALMMLNMVIAASWHLVRGDSFIIFSHALELAIVFLSLVLIGPGKYMLSKKCFCQK
jgi:putative oxidoreductase